MFIMSSDERYSQILRKILIFLTRQSLGLKQKSWRRFLVEDLAVRIFSVSSSSTVISPTRAAAALPASLPVVRALFAVLSPAHLLASSQPLLRSSQQVFMVILLRVVNCCRN